MKMAHESDTGRGRQGNLQIQAGMWMVEGKITVAGWETGGPDGPWNSFAHRKGLVIYFLLFGSLLRNEPVPNIFINFDW
jgi:hypothetical protein